MRNLLNKLEIQLKSNYKTDAEKCIKIYNALNSIDGNVWNTDFRCLVKSDWIDGVLIYFPGKVGEIFLKGLNS